jgi:spore germination protein KB
MNKRETVLSSQMAFILIAFSTGSAIVYIPNPIAAAARNASWLSLLLAYGFGMLLLTGILYLYRSHSGAGMIEYTRRLAGRPVSMIVAVILAGMLLFAIPAIVAGVGDFFTSTMMRETPGYVFNTLTLATAAFTIRCGVRAMARMFELLVVGMLAFSFGVMALALLNYHPTYLLPLFPQGVKPVLHAAFIASGFPFGEVVFLSMLLPFVRREDAAKVSKGMYLAFSVTGITLIISTLSTLMAFGPASGMYRYSLFMIARKINFGYVVERIESVIGITLMVGSFMKSTLYLFILNQILTQLFKLKDDKLLVYPLTVLSILLSLTMFDNPADFNEHVYVIWPFIVIAAGGALVALLTLLTLIKKGAARSWNKKSPQR